MSERQKLIEDGINYINTSQVVVLKEQGKQSYFLPAYVRFLIKEIDAVDKGEISARMSGTLIISFYYGCMNKDIVNKFIGQDAEKAIVVQFNKEESIQLKEGKGITLKEFPKQKMVQYTVRKSFETSLKGKMFFAPFTPLSLYLLVTLQSVSFKNEDENLDISIKFNCMNNKSILLLRNGQNLSFGTVQLAPNQFSVAYSNTRKYPFQADDTIVDNEDVEDEQSIKYFQYAHFKIGVFQDPLPSLLKVFIPLALLGLMTLFVYFQEQSFSARLITIATLALAYVSLIGTIYSQFPSTASIKFIEILILFQLIGTILLILESFEIRNQASFVFVWSENGYFLGTLIINVLIFSIIIIQYIYHRCVQVTRYQKKNPNDLVRKKSKKIIKQDWRNKQCNDYFNQYKRDNPRKNICTL